MAALRGGAGLVRLAVPDVCLDTVAGFEPSYMTVAAAVRSPQAGSRGDAAWSRIVELGRLRPRCRLRPGPGPLAGPRRAGRPALPEIAKPMVFDADALNALAAQPDVLGPARRAADPHAASRRVRPA